MGNNIGIENKKNNLGIENIKTILRWKIKKKNFEMENNLEIETKKIML